MCEDEERFSDDLDVLDDSWCDLSGVINGFSRNAEDDIIKGDFFEKKPLKKKGKSTTLRQENALVRSF